MVALRTPAASTQPRCLSDLRRGQKARITSVSEERGAQLAHRLIDLGLEPGRSVQVGRRAPLGDPTVYHVADYQVSLRRRDAVLVLIEPDTDGSDAAISADADAAAPTPDTTPTTPSQPKA